MTESMNSRMMFVFVLCITIFVSMFVLSSEARLLPTLSFSTNGGKNIDSESLLREVTRNLKRSDEYELQERRSMLGQNGQLEKISPAGPDSQHH